MDTNTGKEKAIIITEMSPTMANGKMDNRMDKGNAIQSKELWNTMANGKMDSPHSLRYPYLATSILLYISLAIDELSDRISLIIKWF